MEEGLGGAPDEEADLAPRPPVITVMGHVDHGKTSILDAIRKSDHAAKEAGGITQHIGASFVSLGGGRNVCFIDTPGHAAFTALRARGADATDVVVLVVAGDDGVKEQTREAADHAKAAGAAIVVAVNKMDKPESDLARVKSELMGIGLVPEDSGGDVQIIPVSAASGEGIEALLEAVFLQGELLELRANPDRPAQGTVLEARLEQGRGAVATVLVRRGSLKVGESFVAGGEFGRVRALNDWRGARVKRAGPSEPVEVIGFSDVPAAGDDFVVVENDQRAREIAEARKEQSRKGGFAAAVEPRITDAEELLHRMEEAGRERAELRFVLKADAHGSAEAVSQAMAALDGEEVAVKVLRAGVGGVSESDVLLAQTARARVLGFGVRAAPKARELARRNSVEMDYYATIYDLLDAVRALVRGQLAPESKEERLGEAEIREVFQITKTGAVAGCFVADGLVRRSARVRILREGEILHEGALRSLRRFKDEAAEVRSGQECGMAFEGFQDFRAGDRVECFEVREIARDLPA